MSLVRVQKETCKKLCNQSPIFYLFYLLKSAKKLCDQSFLVIFLNYRENLFNLFKTLKNNI